MTQKERSRTEPDQRTGSREAARFECEDPDESGTARAEGTPNGQLVASGHGTDAEERGQVGERDQHHEGHRGRQHENDRADRLDGHPMEGLREEAPPFEGWVLRRDPLHDVVHLAVGVVEGCPRGQSGQDVVVDPPPVVRRQDVVVERGEEGGGRDELEALGQDADDRARTAVEGKRGSDRLRVTVQAIAPEPVGDHHDGSSAGVPLRFGEEPAKHRLDTKDVEEVDGGADDVVHLRTSVDHEVVAVVVEGGDRVERRDPVLQIDVAGTGDHVAQLPFGDVAPPHHHHAIGVRVGRVREQRPLRIREHGGVHGHRGGEHDDRRRHVSPAPSQRARHETRVEHPAMSSTHHPPPDSFAPDSGRSCDQVPHRSHPRGRAGPGPLPPVRHHRQHLLAVRPAVVRGVQVEECAPEPHGQARSSRRSRGTRGLDEVGLSPGLGAQHRESGRCDAVRLPRCSHAPPREPPSPPARRVRRRRGWRSSGRGSRRSASSRPPSAPRVAPSGGSRTSAPPPEGGGSSGAGA